MAGPTRTPLRVARNGMVASGNPLVSALGLDVLRAGGNAVDAAVAMGFALAVAEPRNSQLGGDVVIQYWDASTKQLFTIDGCGEAPASIGPVGAEGAGSLRDANRPVLRGLRSAAVPGAVYGWLTALRRWGTRKPAEIVAPAVSIADKGVALSTAQVMEWRRFADVINGHPHMADAFKIDPLRAGALLRQPRLAETLRQIGEGGRAAFYAGPFAEKLVVYSERNGAGFTLPDLKQHRSRIQDPLLTSYRGHTVTETPLSSQGVLLLEMLNVVELHELAQVRPESADAIHLIAESKKLAFADRDAYLGDTGDAPASSLTSKSYADRQRKRINRKAAAARFPAGKLPRHEGQELPAPFVGNAPHTLTEGGSTCVCAVDEAGNAVVMVQGLGAPFGSGVVVPDTGVLLNNRLADFHPDPSSPNGALPGRVPLSPLNTYMIFRGDDLWAIGGTAGGDSQIETNAQVITNLIDHGRNPQEAVEAPRWYAHDGGGLSIEERLPLDACYDLRTLGHQLLIEGPWSAPCACQVIVVDDETKSLLGASDPRVDGLAVGF